MKNRTALISILAAAAALATVCVNAQEIDTYSGSSGPGFNAQYSDDDLVLVFFSASDETQTTGVNSQGDLLFNLGPVSSFTGLSPGTYSVAGFNGSVTPGQPPVGSGSSILNSSLTVPSDGTFWTVMASDHTSDQLWLTGTTAQHQLSRSVQGQLAGQIATIGASGASIPNPGNASAFDGSQTTGNYLLPSGIWINTSVVADDSVPSTSDTLALYSLIAGTGGAGSSTELGYFTLTYNNGAETLTFTVPASGPPSSAARLVNISSRAYVGTGANLEIAGFVVAGPPGSTEQVLIRGVGPALSQFGVAGVLANPVLTLFDSSGNQLATNKGWSTASNAAAISSATTTAGAFSLPSGGADSAMLVSLSPGAYTAEIASANATPGVALAEVYEVASGTAALINISTRAYVGTGSSVEIGGFVVRGTQPEKVLVRAVGPALGQFGVSGTLAQPSLNVVDSSGNTVASNTGWSNNSNAATIASEAASAGAFALPAGSADSALLLTLQPGSYTAVVSGANGTSGVALVEVYQAP